jgi:hypothetical protein
MLHYASDALLLYTTFLKVQSVIDTPKQLHDAIPTMAAQGFKGLKRRQLYKGIRKLDTREYAPQLSYVRSMANQLLAEHSGGEVGEKWVRKLVRRRPEIESQVTRRRSYRRVLCSDPAVISPWFNLVRNVKAKYGVLNEDTYNFDETGFQMGIGGSVKVVTASERRLKPIGVQSGDREWATLIAGINARGWSTPPFFTSRAAVVNGKRRMRTIPI